MLNNASRKAAASFDDSAVVAEILGRYTVDVPAYNRGRRARRQAVRDDQTAFIDFLIVEQEHSSEY